MTHPHPDDAAEALHKALMGIGYGPEEAMETALDVVRKAQKVANAICDPGWDHYLYAVQDALIGEGSKAP